MTNLLTQQSQVCVILEKFVSEICTGVGRLVQEMGPLLVLDCAPGSARHRRSDPPAQTRER